MLDVMQRKQWDPLVKQTYSVWVDGPKGRRKWHLSKRYNLTCRIHAHISGQAANAHVYGSIRAFLTDVWFHSASCK